MFRYTFAVLSFSIQGIESGIILLIGKRMTYFRSPLVGLVKCHDINFLLPTIVFSSSIIYDNNFPDKFSQGVTLLAWFVYDGNDLSHTVQRRVLKTLACHSSCELKKKTFLSYCHFSSFFNNFWTLITRYWKV